MQENIKRKNGMWRTFNDLAQAANDVTEDIAGNIVIATWGGLCILRGQRYRYLREQDGLGCNSINRVIRDRAGHLWLGTLDGVSRYDGHSFRNFTPADGLAGTNVLSLYADGKGRVWAGTRSGISCIEDLAVRNFTAEYGGPECRVYSICEDEAGNMWFGTAEGVFRFDGSRFSDMAAVAGFPRDYSRAVFKDSRGLMWVAFDDKGLFTWSGDVLVEFRPDDMPVRLVTCILEDGGAMWLGSWEKVRCCSGGETVCFGVEDGMCSAEVTRMFRDSSGRFWFACSYKGLSCYDPHTVTYISRQYASECMVKGLNGKFWWGNGPNLVRCRSGLAEHVATFDSAIDTIFEDSLQRVWVCTVGPRFYRCDLQADKGGLAFSDVTPLFDGIKKSRVEVFAEDRDGAIWIGYWSGMARFTGTAFEPVLWHDRVGKAISYSVFDLQQDARGTFWMAGYHDDGLLSYDGRTFRRYTKKDGLVHDRVHRIRVDSRGRVWAGTIHGISCFDGTRFENYPADSSLEIPFINGITEDRQGCLWFATAGAGVCRYNGCEFQFLGESDGLPGNHVIGVEEDADGSFLIATSNGVCRYVPDNVTRPQVFIEHVEAGGLHNSLTSVVVNASIPHVQISYGGLSPRTNRMRFRYILEGYDKQWTSTWDCEVRYEWLPVGEYIFKVMAVNRDLLASEETAELRLAVIPDPRDRKIGELEENRRQVEHQLQINNMRLRIARDLHDEVGANLGSISLLAQLVERSGVTSGDVREIRQIAISTIESLREIVWMIDPQHDRLDDLISRMKDVAEVMLAGLDFDFQFGNLDENVQVPLELRRNIMPVFKEILHNVRRHSKADRVDIRGAYEAGAFGFCIADNGCGFDPSLVSPGNGLMNIRRRIEEVHGSIRVESGCGTGTAISFHVPLTVA